MEGLRESEHEWRRIEAPRPVQRTPDDRVLHLPPAPGRYEERPVAGPAYVDRRAFSSVSQAPAVPVRGVRWRLAMVVFVTAMTAVTAAALI